jgi:glycerol-3-phosphate dehydrogenase
MTTGTPALDRRDASFAALGEPFDLLVIGGGVNGLAIAWDASLAGLRTVVVDKGDWGSGTSSRSSRMIHGGLKYLERYDVRLVRESLRDRDWLLQRAPHLVTPLPFVLPFYDRNRHPPAVLRAGMVAYDILSLGKSVPRHEVLTREEMLRRLPGISAVGLTGGARYHDAQVEYTERLCAELMLAARHAGAVTLNHTRVTALETAGSAVGGARVVDGLTGREHRIQAGATLNVAGAWVDDVVAGTSAASRRWIGGTKGTHLVVGPFEGAPDDAVYFESEDGRPMTVIPWLGMYLIGSTDKRFAGDLDTVSADEEEIGYILRETNTLFPLADLTEDWVVYAHTGVRPLPHVGAERTADTSGRHEIHDHGPELAGLYSVVGGRLTTFRSLAKHALQLLRGRMPVGPSRLGDQRLPGSGPTAGLPPDLDPALRARLTRIYGSRADRVLALAGEDPGLLAPLGDPADGMPEPVDGQPCAAEVLLAVREEEAVHLADVLARRTMAGLHADLGRSVAVAAAGVMAPELGWSDEDIAAELGSYEGYLRRFEPPWQPVPME